ncbi:AfsR/SARP family transcriptional regulator [Streptomyces sp. NPDC090022]|uniref:AfsR/SARP family transcriptional regulator n=1 Tax=Streptomyces sp. NPDC090022 TaxID=3365920 RepID=UPI00382FA6A7
MPLVFALLGPVQATLDGRPLPLGGPRGRRVLAALLLEAGRAVPVAGLARAVWDDAPATAREQLHNVAASLRRLLAGTGATVTRSEAGLTLEPGPAVLDVREFARLRAAAGSAPAAEARPLLAAALELWRGPALGGLGGRLFEAAAARLEEERLDCLERRLTADLELGRHAEVCGELASLTAEHPLRERLVELRMLALYRSGRRGEALDCFTRARRSLADAAGLDPRPELHALYGALLADAPPPHPTLPPHPTRALTPHPAREPAPAPPPYPIPASEPAPAPAPHLAPAPEPAPVPEPAPAPAPGPPAPAPLDAVASPVPPAPVAPVPAQLPPATEAFVGRVVEAAALVPALRAAGGGVCVVTGQAGIGKTALAVEVARSVREDFPDGQLFVDLRGADQGAADPAEVLAGFLRGLGVDGACVPAAAGERAALYRSLLAGRRVLVVLDNAAGEEQVRALLPGPAGSGCAVLVTSRRRLTGLDRRLALTLPVLAEADALGLLGRVVGHGRVAGEAGAARELVALCGRLPLALRVVAARLAAAPHRELARLAARLRDERGRLDELAHHGGDVRAGLRLSYRALPAEARALLRALAVLDAPDCAGWVAAALLDRPPERAEEALDALVGAHLLEVAGRDEAGQLRYRLHDLVRAFGRELAAPGPADAALRRALGCWVALVRAGRRAHQGLDYPGLGRGAPAAAPRPGRAAGWEPEPGVLALVRAEPVRWLGAEREALVATVRQAAAVDPYACRELAAAGEYLFDLRSDLTGWQTVQESALAAARAAGDRTGQALMLVGLGRLRACRVEWGPARETVAAGERLFEELGDAHGAAYAGWVLAYLDRVQGRLPEALERCRRIAPVFEAAGDRYGQAHALRGIGQVLLAGGDSAGALDVLREALAVAVRGGAAWPRMCMLRWVADAQLVRGRLAEAAAGFREVLAHTEGSGDLAGQSAARIGLGRIALERGDTAQALRQLRAADELGRRSGQTLVHALAVPPLARALLAAGETAAARALLEEAQEGCRRMNARPLLEQLRAALAAVPSVP